MAGSKPATNTIKLQFFKRNKLHVCNLIINSTKLDSSEFLKILKKFCHMYFNNSIWVRINLFSKFNPINQLHYIYLWKPNGDIFFYQILINESLPKKKCKKFICNKVFLRES